jgi:DNA invertase Pin-like site-specific DNA recombinase
MAFPVGRPKRGVIPQDEEQRVVRVYNNGGSLHYIAEAYDVTVHEVKRVLHEYGVKLRKRGRITDEEFKQRLLRALGVKVDGN